MKFYRKLLFIAVILGILSLPPRADAMTFGDAALSVGVASGVGAVLGASTLPFYSESGAHVRNIYYGAAIGAVIGVVLSAAVAMQQAPDINGESADYTMLKKSSAIAIQPHSVLEQNPEALWSPLATVRF